MQRVVARRMRLLRPAGISPWDEYILPSMHAPNTPREPLVSFQNIRTLGKKMAKEEYASHQVSFDPAGLGDVPGNRFVVLVPGVVNVDEVGVPSDGRPIEKLELMKSTGPGRLS